MTLAEIRDEAWDTADEIGTSDADRFWPTAQMNRYINRIIRHIARETRCIKDSTTPAICLIASNPVDYTTYAAGSLDALWAANTASPLYQLDVCPYLFDLHSSVIDVDEVKLMTKQWELRKVASRKWQTNPIWEQCVSSPTEYATDLASKKLAVNFRSEEADVLQLIVTRLPLVDLSDDADEPEIRNHYHDYILDGVLWLMYSKPDAETYDMVKASTHKKAFENGVDEIKQSEVILHDRLNVNHSMPAFR